MNILSYEIFNKINNLSHEWNLISSKLTEGITFDPDSRSYLNSDIKIDYDTDTEEDIVKLAEPRNTIPTRLNKIPTFSGYVLEKLKEKKLFSEYMKEWESISDSDLNSLINHTYPSELKDKQVKVLFVTGSGSPLASRIAESIKSLYYPKAKIVDVMKAYYGSDMRDIIDKERYEKADPVTKKEIDTFIKANSGSFKGLVKKSGGLRSGSRRLLKPGHMIDDYIIDSIKDTQEEYASYFKRSTSSNSVNMNALIKMKPSYLLVDDLIIEGSTMRGIFKMMIDAISNNKSDIPLLNNITSSLYGYTLFSYRSKF